jgi:hypothetical protein
LPHVTKLTGYPNLCNRALDRLHLPPYTKEQFLDIAVRTCPKLKEEISRIIGEEVWKQGNKDIRDVISLGKLLRKGDGPEEIEGLVKTLAKCV